MPDAIPSPPCSPDEEVVPVQAPATRLFFVDNIRWTMIILVVSMHAADTYSPLGNWYFVDRKPLSTGSLLFFAAWQMYLQSFFMGLLFFTAGFFVPRSFDRKGPVQFLRDRAFRLGLPVLFYTFLLGPITEYFVAVLDIDATDILCERMVEAHPERPVSTGERPSMVLFSPANFLAWVRHTAQLI